MSQSVQGMVLGLVFTGALVSGCRVLSGSSTDSSCLSASGCGSTSASPTPGADSDDEAETCTTTSTAIEQTTTSSSGNLVGQIAQSITPSVAMSVSDFELYFNVNTATSMTVRLYQGGGTDPDSGTLMATATYTNTTQGAMWRSIEFSTPQSLTAGQLYWFLIEAAGGTAVVHYNGAADAYAQGEFRYPNGFVWSVQNFDMAFRVNQCTN